MLLHFVTQFGSGAPPRRGGGGGGGGRRDFPKEFRARSFSGRRLLLRSSATLSTIAVPLLRGIPSSPSTFSQFLHRCRTALVIILVFVETFAMFSPKKKNRFETITMPSKQREYKLHDLTLIRCGQDFTSFDVTKKCREFL